MREITISHGLSLGLFGVALLVIGVPVLSAVLIESKMIRDYLRGRLRFVDLTPVGQWVVLTFLNGGDGGGYA